MRSGRTGVVVAPKPNSWFSSILYYANNWITLTGIVLVTSAGLIWLFLLPTMLSAGAVNAYMGLLTYFALPAVFFLGLALIPVGIWFRRWRDDRADTHPVHFPPVDWHHPELRRIAMFVGVTTLVNLVMGTQLTYKAVEHMHSVEFCGATCHTPMEPEYMAYQVSAHSHVACAECHIGGGMSAFVQAKLNGVSQLMGVMTNHYSRPIPVPVKHLRPASEICESCHAHEQGGGNRLKVFTKYNDDEKNSISQTVMMLKLGEAKQGQGIHGAHLGTGVAIKYGFSDDKREKIAWVERTDASGVVTEYWADGKVGDKNKLTLRTMDCLDCHNRPAHTFQTAEKAIDKAIAHGQIPADLPFVRKKGIELLKAPYASFQEASGQIEAKLALYYQQNYGGTANAGQVKKAANGLREVYSRNVFPAMKVTWGSYTNNIGHTDYPGCFRCHDEGHVAIKSKKTITQDCTVCHNALAVDEAEPKILSDLGLASAASH